MSEIGESLEPIDGKKAVKEAQLHIKNNSPTALKEAALRRFFKGTYSPDFDFAVRNLKAIQFFLGEMSIQSLNFEAYAEEARVRAKALSYKSIYEKSEVKETQLSLMIPL